MKLFVIMGNDYPNGVCSSEEIANAAIERLKETDLARAKAHYGEEAPAPRIYYRTYEFTLNEVK